MRKDDVFPSRFLKASDLGGKAIVVTIASAVLETLKSTEGKEQSKIVLGFVGGKKVLPLNVTNFDAVVDASGEGDSDRWIGHKIELFPSRTAMGGKMVDCIRIRPPAQPQLGAKVPALVSEADPPPVDAIPADAPSGVPWL